MTPTRLAAALRLAGYVRENKIFVTKTVALALADALLYLYEQAETGRSQG